MVTGGGLRATPPSLRREEEGLGREGQISNMLLPSTSGANTFLTSAVTPSGLI